MIHLEDIQAARKRIGDVAYRTPIMKSEQLSRVCGNEMFLKSEHLQKTGSFKIRGATNKVKKAVEEGAKYVATASSGNHGQAVAYIANRLGVPATVVVPVDANPCKIAAIEAYDGVVEKCGTRSDERLPRAKEIARQKGGVYIAPYDDPLIMAGQGTIGLEILEQIPDVDAVLVPIGGGGLLSGILTAIKELKPDIQVIGVEPLIANDTYLSLQNRKIISIGGSVTIADGLRASQPGDLTFPVITKYIDDVVLVSEDEIRQAFYFILERMKQLIEPSSATTIAAAMFNKLPFHGKRVAAVITGGNIDLSQVSNLISG